MTSDSEDVFSSQDDSFYQSDIFNNRMNELGLSDDTRRSRLRRKLNEQEGFGEVVQESPIFTIRSEKQLAPQTSQRIRRTTLTKVVEISHNLNNMVDLLRAGEEIDELFSSLVTPTLSGARPNDHVAVSIQHPELHRPIYVTNLKKNFDMQDLLNTLYEVSQSNGQFLLDGQFTIETNISQNVTGHGRSSTSKPPQNTKASSDLKRSVFTIVNLDSSCGYRALALGKWRLDHQSDTDFAHKWRNSISHQSQAPQEQVISGFVQEFGLDVSTPVDYGILRVISQKLPDYEIVVMVRHQSEHSRDAQLGYRSENRSSKQIFLELVDGGVGHFNLITNIRGYLGKHHFCQGCLSSTWRPHSCPQTCPSCNAYPKCPGEVTSSCLSCKSDHFSSICAENHKCQKVTCRECQVSHNKRMPHQCFKRHCLKCKDFYTVSPHHCTIQPLDPEKLKKQDEKRKIFVFFDIESRIGDSDQDGFSRHDPILLISHTVCDECYRPENVSAKNAAGWLPVKPSSCSVCGDLEKVFKGPKCVKEFGDYLYLELAVKASKEKARVFVLAHNFQRYDGRFVFRDLFTRDFESPSVIMNGSKIIKLDQNNIRFIDSLSFLQMALAKFPKSFGFQERDSKKKFPYLFKSEFCWDYEGPLPDISLYGLNHMKEEQAAELRRWYSSVPPSYIFNFQNEIIDYCREDVAILTVGVMKFRSLFIQTTGIDPLTRNFTLASIGLEAFSALSLKPNVLGITPLEDYTGKRKHSMEGSAWLDMLEENRSITILREQPLGPYYVDGYHPETKTVFEYFGCYWHGCQTCNLSNEKYEATKIREQYFLSHGFKFESIWSHDFKPLLGLAFVQLRMTHYRERKEVEERTLREAVFGGRTNNIKFYHKARQDEQILYQDVCSLYPFVLKNKPYPVGHPEIIMEKFDYSLQSYFGYIQCTVIPPRKLRFPVLPSRIDNKLMFVLCRTCATEKKVTCTHSVNERSLSGIWTTAELNVALTKGYLISQIEKVLHFKERDSTIFADYINMWLKHKVEASGFPTEVQTTEQKLEFIRMYKEKEGLDLDMENIQLNPGLRMLAKLMLNSLWGKLCQRPNLPQTTLCTDQQQHWDLITDDSKKIIGEANVADDKVLTSWQMKEVTSCRQGKVDLAVGAFVTSYGRLHLYNLIDTIEAKRQNRIIYYDTDSIIYTAKHESEIERTGTFLGDLTDETVQAYGSEARITEIACLGPKNYGYITKKGDQYYTNIKAKGVTLTSATKNIVTFEQMKLMALSYTIGEQGCVQVPQQLFHGDKYHQLVHTKTFDKLFRATSDKRAVVGNNTLPYGF